MNVYQRCQRHRRKKRKNLKYNFFHILLTPEVSSFCKTISGRRYCLWNSHEKAQRHLTHSGQRPQRPPKRHYLVLAASGASDQDVWGVYEYNFSWRFQWHHRQPWPTSAAGDMADLSPSIFSYHWQLPHLHGILVLVTDNKFIAGVVVTSDNFSPMVHRW